ncbi:ABC transporter substrate-binding protein [Motilibacter aurantiacus]|uniref:ABC transporter substrate-binding protein n=1 Tax=Motilibacter aurantiacus TaxID=2714955 RepID=UPI0014081B4E|nr:ABC transporter substrate-binding protein [Motilibacter aurantiacus]
MTALLLSGCFSSSADEPDGAAPTASGERISVAMLQPPRSGLTPFSDDAFKLSRWSTAETLVVLDEAGDAQPALATAWEQVDPRTWRFEVRQGVTFHDGTPLTAEHVAAVLTAATKASPKPRILDGVELTAQPDPAAPGEAVLVRTGDADPLVPQRMSSPQLSILAAAAYGPDGTVDPVGHGTGPFELVAVDGTVGATLNRFDGYWGERARVAGIDVDFVPDGTARAAALRTGAADVVEAVPVSQASLLEPEQVFEVPMPRTNTLYLNTERGVFADAGMRAAARGAVQRETIVENVYEGRADVAEGLLGPALPWAAEGRPARSERPAADPAGAEIVLATFTDRAELPEVAVQLEQQLEAAGFRVRQEVREYAQIEADALAGDFDAFILSRATVLDSGDPVAYMYSDFACDGSFNIAQLCDPEIDAALRKASAAGTGDARRAATLEAERLILESDAAIPMLHERVIQGESGDFSGVARDPRERQLITAETTAG